MYSIEDILEASRLLKVNFDKFSLDDLVTGVNIEVEKEKRVTSTLFLVRFNFFNTITNNFKKTSQSIITFFM